MHARISHFLPYLAVPLAAFLTFLIQPVVGKLVLPLYGGGSGTWIISMFFFQGALLGGYLLAYGVVKQSFGTQKKIVVFIAICAPLCLRLPLYNIGNSVSPVSLLITLALSIGIQLLFTTAIGIIIQGWIQRSSSKIPYHLYAISNVGSLVALLAYPFLIEPNVGLETQILVLRLASVILSTTCLILVGSMRTNEHPSLLPSHEKICTARKGYWLLLSFLNCVLMMGATRILSVEFGSNPLTWVIPLGLYLASFTVTFTARWNDYANITTLILLCAALPFFMLDKGVMSTPLTGHAILALVVLIATASLMANSLLYEKRPSHDFGGYYLVIALGGAIGGFFVSLSAPALFSRNYEFLGAAVVIAALAIGTKISRRGVSSILASNVLLVAPLIVMGAEQIAAENRGGVHTLNLRNYFGHIVLRATAGEIRCASETTLHGSQFIDPERRRIPTSYYSEGSCIGLILRDLQRENPEVRVGVIGLGVGILATYMRSSDSVVFWEIDPLMREVALNAFSFISQAEGRTEICMMDGRLAINATDQQFNLLVIDAFEGDAIPLHLVTREALQEYVKKTQSGIIAINISNRYVDLFPVLAAHAKAMGLEARAILSIPPPKLSPRELLSAPSRYVIVSPAAIDAKIKSLIADAPPRTGWSYRSRKTPAKLIDWTDSRHSILDVLDLRAALRGETIDSGKL